MDVDVHVTAMVYEIVLIAVIVKAILHYAVGLRFGNLKHSKTHEKTQLNRIFTRRIV